MNWSQSNRSLLIVFCIGSAFACGCKSEGSAQESEAKSASQEGRSAPLAVENASSAVAKPPPPSEDLASVGNPAPDFVLPDLEGNEVKLSDHLGRVVVLEWFNPACPYVKAAHTEGSLRDTASKMKEKGVVYLAINSGAPGKQGHGAEVNRAGAEQFSLTHPILLDETGRVGRLYGATNTPHLFVIDVEGKLAYAGAVDNSPDGEGKSPKGGVLVNYLSQAVTELLSKQAVSVPQTKAYGCSVKYGS